MPDYRLNIQENRSSAEAGGLTESGGQDLSMGVVTDGQILKRVGNELVGISQGNVNELVDLTDVSGADPSIGNILIGDGASYVGRQLVESDISDLQEYLTDLSTETLETISDVNITNLLVNQSLLFDGTNWVNSNIGIIPESTSVIYVSKEGNDSNTGLKRSETKLTISSALTKASEIQGVTSDNVVIKVVDSGIYVENITVDHKQFLVADSATLNGTLILQSDSGAHIHEHICPGSNFTCVTGTGTQGEANSFYKCDLLNVDGDGVLLVTASTGVTAEANHTINVNIGTIKVSEEGAGLYSESFGAVNGYINNIILSGDNSNGILHKTTSSYINAFIGQIIKTGGTSGTIGIKMENTGSISTTTATVSRIDADESYNVSSGTLFLTCNNISGTKTGSVSGPGTITDVGAVGNISIPDHANTVAANAALRGNYGVDLMIERDADDQVAGGPRSVLIGGAYNKITADSINGGIFAGDYHIVEDNSAVILGGTLNKILNLGVNNTSVRAGILGGTANEIHSSNDSVILGGTRNRIEGGALKAVILGGADNVINGASESLAHGDSVNITHTGAKLFGNDADTQFNSIADNEFAIQAPHLRLDDGNQQAGYVLTCDANGSGTWGPNTNPHVFNAKDYAVGDGVADDTTALINLIASVSALQGEATTGFAFGDGDLNIGLEIDLNGGVYLITDTLYIGKTIHIRNGSFKATGAMTDAANYMMILNAGGVRLSDVTFSAGDQTTAFANCLKVNRDVCRLNNVSGTGFIEYGLHVDGTARGLQADSCFFKPWKYDLNGPYGDETQQAGKHALFIEQGTAGSYSKFSKCFFEGGEFCAKIQSASSTFVDCRFASYIDQSSPTINPITVYMDGITAGIGMITYIGCDFIGGSVVLESNDNYDYRKQFIGCRFISYDNSIHSHSIILKHNSTNTDIRCNGFVVQGCLFELYAASGTEPILFDDTSNTGKFGAEELLKISWVGNINPQTGNPVFLDAKFGANVTIKNSILQDNSGKFYPSYYGAVGDGVADDTVAIQAAIDAAEASLLGVINNFDRPSNTVVDLEGKSYRITDTLVINKSIIFENGSLLTTSAMAGVTASSTYMIKIDPTGDFATIRNILMDGGTNGAEATAVSNFADGIESAGGHNTLDNVNILHYANTGISFPTGGTRSNIHNCYIAQWNGNNTAAIADTVNITGTAINIDVGGVYVTECFMLYFNTGVLLATGTTQCQVKGNYFSSKLNVINPLAADGINVNAENVVISENVFVESVIRIVRFDENTGGPGIKILGNRFYTNQLLSGIIYETPVANDAVEGLIVSNNIFNANFTDPILFSASGAGSFVNDTDKQIQWVGNIKHDGTTAWVDAKFGVGSLVINDNSVTGTASFTFASNNINLTGVGNLTGLAVGDVIEVTGSVSNNGLYTVEDSGSWDADNIIVNQAHAGGTTLKSLTEENGTASVTVAIHCKAKDAPLGMGQGWMTPSYGTALQTNSTGRPIVYNVYASGAITALNVDVDGVQVCAVNAGQSNVNTSATIVIPNGSTFQRNVTSSQGTQRILR